jgi:acyl-CoA thioester hydrolase
MNTRHLTYRGTVYPWHCDHVGHMNVMWYVGKFDEATWNLFHQIGITPAYLREQQRGMAAVDQHIEYKRELKAGDVVTVYSEILELHDRKIRFRHEMRSADGGEAEGELAAVTTLLGVHMDTQLRKSCAFAPALSQRMKAFMQAQGGRPSA